MLKASGLQILITAGVLLTAAQIGAADGDVDKLIAEIISGARTNSARAVKLLAVATPLADQPKICVAVLEKAVYFGAKSPVTPAGCKSASSALDMLEAEFPDRKDQWTLKRASVCSIAYRCARTRSDKQEAGGKFLTALMAAAKIHEANADWTQAATMYRQASAVDTYLKMGGAADIRRKLKKASHMTLVARRAVQYAASLKKDPSKTATRAALIKTLVVELDNPKAAVAHLNEDVDERWRTYVPLAARDIGELPEAPCLELAQWYSKELAPKASPSGKSISLRRARSYYQHFIDIHGKVDIQTFRTKSALAELDKQLAKLNAPTVRRVPRPTRTRKSQVALSLADGVTMKLVKIPAGRFTMSSPESETGRLACEGKQRIVTISKPFYIGVTEVTQRQWRAVMATEPWSGRDSAKSDPNNAASYVSKRDIEAFCGRLSKKTSRKITLPTEAQWEYACRAGTGSAFCFGDDPSRLGDFAWFGLDKKGSEAFAHPVGKKKPNAWGLYDMHGNVYEWCLDPYDEDSYTKAGNTDPICPGPDGLHVVRGGSFTETGSSCRSSNRNKCKRLDRKCGLGFRIVVLAGSR